MPPTQKSTAKKKPVKKSPAKKSTAKKKTPLHPLVKITIWLSGIFFLLFVLFLTASLMIFSPYRKIGEPKFSNYQLQVISKITSHATSRLFRRKPVLEAKLRLSPDEVNAILEFARLNSGLREGLPPPWSFDISYNPNGSFSFNVPVDVAPEWFFGGKIYAKGDFFLEKQREQIFLNLPKLNIGRAGIPVPGCNEFAGKAGETAIRDAMPPIVNAAIKEFYPERDGSLVIVYRPAKIIQLLTNFNL